MSSHKLLGAFILLASMLLIGVNPMKAQVANGAAIYQKRCKSCHGKVGDKGLMGASNLTASALEESSFYKLLAEGRKKMPVFNQLPQEEKQALYSFVKSLRLKK